MKELKIANITLSNRYILAPMAGYTNYPLRALAKEGGASLTYTEMISATALMYGNKKTFDMLPRDKGESPLALQLFGGDKDVILKAIPIIEKEASYDFLDFNMGCPVPKVMKQQAGSYWLKREDEIYDLLKSMVEISSKPVIIKIRLGFDKEHVNALEIAKIAEKAGVKAIAVHARTRDQYYNGLPNYEEIAKIKEAISIPVIANGNITLDNIDEVSRNTNADGFMIGRGALGNPYIFQDFIDQECGKPKEDRNLEFQLSLMDKHLLMLIAEMGEKNALKYFRGLAVLYVKGFANSKSIKNRLVTMTSYRDFKEIIESIKSEQ